MSQTTKSGQYLCNNPDIICLPIDQEMVYRFIIVDRDEAGKVVKVIDPAKGWIDYETATHADASVSIPYEKGPFLSKSEIKSELSRADIEHRREISKLNSAWELKLHAAMEANLEDLRRTLPKS